METTGTLIADPICTDINGKNKWSFVLEVPGKYPTNIAFTAWADKGDVLHGLAAGQELTVKANVESREYSGRWYTDVKAWSIAVKGGASSGGRAPAPVSVPTTTKAAEPEQDLPF